MKTIIKNQHGNIITDRYNHETKLTNYCSLIEHMAVHGYASVNLDGHEVTVKREDLVDDERVIFVNVEGI